MIGKFKYFHVNNISLKIDVKIIISSFFMSKTSMCKIPYKIQWNIDEMLTTSYFSQFSHTFVNSALFAPFHKFPHISHIFVFLLISRNFTFLIFFAPMCHMRKVLCFPNENGALFGPFRAFGWNPANIMKFSYFS